VDVMQGGESSSDCSEPPCTYKAFRIPGLVAVGNDTLLAFAEGRKSGCGDFAAGYGHDMVLKKSVDGGHTWGPLNTIVDAIAFWPNVTANKPPETGNAVWDPTPLWDRVTGVRGVLSIDRIGSRTRAHACEFGRTSMCVGTTCESVEERTRQPELGDSTNTLIFWVEVRHL
jgi:hypothetical protein